MNKSKAPIPSLPPSRDTHVASLLLHNGFELLLAARDEVILHAGHKLADVARDHRGVAFGALQGARDEVADRSAEGGRGVTPEADGVVLDGDPVLRILAVSQGEQLGRH